MSTYKANVIPSHELDVNVNVDVREEMKSNIP